MALVNASQLYATAFLTGVLLHTTTLRFGEWDTYALAMVACTLLLDVVATLGLRYGVDTGALSIWGAFWLVSSGIGTCVAGIFSSILVYRLAFHRLNRFPGPFLARISNVYPTSLSLKGFKFQLYLETQALHRQYGDIVRLADPRAIELMHSNQTPCIKGPWYNILWPGRPLNAVRDKTAHAKRRRTWDKGLGASALRDYEPRVVDYTTQLLDRIEQSHGVPMDAAKWFNLYSFDVMGDIGFGRGFGMLRDGKANYLVSSSRNFMVLVRLFSHLVWLFPLYKLLPVVNTDVKRFEGWLVTHVQQRRERQCVDLFSWILQDYESLEKPTLQETIDLHADALLVVIAGSDTTAMTLTGLFFELAQQPRVAGLLQEEIDQCYSSSENVEPTAQSLAKLEYLQACITEALRKWPAAPSGLQRMTPPGGLQLGDVFIPGEVVVQCPQYAMFRDERLFTRPDEFLPERWTTRPELVNDLARETSAFVPFSTGRFACAGKSLALMELRYAVSRIMRRGRVVEYQSIPVFVVVVVVSHPGSSHSHQARRHSTVHTMPIESRWSVPIPEGSLPTYVFGSPSGPVPDFLAYVDADNPSRTLTLHEFRHHAKRIAIGLRRQGVRPGDSVLLYSRNDIYFPCLFFGVIMCGAIFTGASPAFGPNELAYQLKDSGAKVLVAATDVLDNAVAAAKQAGLPTAQVFRFDGSTVPTQESADRKGQDVPHWSKLLASDREADTFQWWEPKDPGSETCCLNYSSGTTGRPKGVEVTHRSYIANSQTGVCMRGLAVEARGEDLPSRALCFMPTYHAAAQTGYMINAPKLGVSTYMMSAYSLERLLRNIQEHKITDVLVAPPVVVSLVSSPLRNRYDLSSVRNITCGTAPLAPGLIDEAARLFNEGAVRIRQAWGMTELTCTGSVPDPRIAEMDAHSVGEVAPNCRIKLVNTETGEEITEAGQRGELWFTGPTLMKAYWRNPTATAETLQIDGDGTRWMKTGDIVTLDRYGLGANIHIVDRAKELIKVKGFQVAPAELEALLLTHDAVVDVGVVGLKVKGDELPRAYIVRAPGSNISEKDICRWVEGQVARYKWLQGGVVFVDAIPKLLSGKILRRALRERAQAEVEGATTAVAKL
ncbi:4-coumarate-CoA ligase [Purpureocillium lavendulum]|uniref:4-coumarate-CoA ligase n=1 Tax=Purpureocillium lavendulum TaxID=1247861 RepID=A0AB34G8J7_9HYPO|nr:4-coumarate-CoA ligase [Purpureocillium lavendulum]